jgi:hypothetical protein
MRALLVATAVLLGACSAAESAPAHQAWVEVKGVGHVVVAAAPEGHGLWLLGGGVIGSDGVNRVAIWSAVAPAGPWRRNTQEPVPGRDGPNETIQGFGTRPGTGPLTAVGSRPSPTEGYPRPSTWTAPSGPPGPPVPPVWREVLAAREVYGGPNVVAIAGMGAGPHGYFIAGTWLAPNGHVVAAVWRSPGGVKWTRNDTDPAFDAGAGTQSYAFAVADGPTGVLLGGTTATPVRGDPTREIPTLWRSADGVRWRRLPALPPGGRGAVHAVRALANGWVAAGQVAEHPEVWLVGADLHTSGAVLPGAAGAVVDDLAVTPGAVLAAGVSAAGTIVVWRATRNGDRLSGWRLVTPPAAGTGWSGASLAAAGNQLVLVASNDATSRVWRAA